MVANFKDRAQHRNAASADCADENPAVDEVEGEIDGEEAAIINKASDNEEKGDFKPKRKSLVTVEVYPASYKLSKQAFLKAFPRGEFSAGLEKLVHSFEQSRAAAGQLFRKVVACDDAPAPGGNIRVIYQCECGCLVDCSSKPGFENFLT